MKNSVNNSHVSNSGFRQTTNYYLFSCVVAVTVSVVFVLVLVVDNVIVLSAAGAGADDDSYYGERFTTQIEYWLDEYILHSL